MVKRQTTCSLGGTASLGLLLPYFIPTIFIAVFPKKIAPSFDGLLTLLRESGRQSESSVKAKPLLFFCFWLYSKRLYRAM